MSSGGEGCKRRNGVGYLELSARLGGHLRGNESNVLHKLFFSFTRMYSFIKGSTRVADRFGPGSEVRFI